MDRARFHDKAAPEAEGCGFVGDEGNAVGDGTPFAQKDQPSLRAASAWSWSVAVLERQRGSR